MLGVKRMPRPLSESRKPESRRKTAVLRGMRLRRIDSPLDFPGQPCACGERAGVRGFGPSRLTVLALSLVGLASPSAAADERVLDALIRAYPEELAGYDATYLILRGR